MRVKLIQCETYNANGRVYLKENLQKAISKGKDYPLYTEEFEKRNYDKWDLSPIGKVSNLHFEGNMLVGDVDVKIQKHLNVVSSSVGKVIDRNIVDVDHIDCFYTTPHTAWDFKSIEDNNLMETE